jgi:hypothetical protein
LSSRHFARLIFIHPQSILADASSIVASVKQQQNALQEQVFKTQVGPPRARRIALSLLSAQLRSFVSDALTSL